MHGSKVALTTRTDRRGVVASHATRWPPVTKTGATRGLFGGGIEKVVAFSIID
jgi:hypothetical protein